LADETAEMPLPSNARAFARALAIRLQRSLPAMMNSAFGNFRAKIEMREWQTAPLVDQPAGFAGFASGRRLEIPAGTGEDNSGAECRCD